MQIRKAHWNCFGNCNCHCKFCYGMFLGHDALGTDQAKVLIDKLVNGGVKELVFGGGDPLMRKDLDTLLDYSWAKGLSVEIQTNAQALTMEKLIQLHPKVARWGLSLDSSIDYIHDRVRGRAGNFQKVVTIAEALMDIDALWDLRTVICRPTIGHFDKIGKLLRELAFVGRWYLLQYSPVGDERSNRELFEITEEEFWTAVCPIQVQYRDSPFTTIPVPDSERQGIYFLIAPDGAVYNHPASGELYAIAGNIITDPFHHLVARLSINFEGHYSRFGTTDPQS